MKICEICGQEFNPRRWTQRRCYPCIDANKKGDEPNRREADKRQDREDNSRE